MILHYNSNLHDLQWSFSSLFVVTCEDHADIRMFIESYRLNDILLIYYKNGITIKKKKFYHALLIGVNGKNLYSNNSLISGQIIQYQNMWETDAFRKRNYLELTIFLKKTILDRLLKEIYYVNENNLPDYNRTPFSV